MTLTTEPPLTVETPEPFASSLDQLEAELQWLALRLRIEVERGRRRRALGPADDYRGLYISDEEVDDLLGAPDEQAGSLGELRRAAASCRVELDARAAATTALGVALPLETLVSAFGLAPEERQALVIALAPHLDQGYAKVFAYVNDDVTRKRPTVGLVLDLLADGRREALALRRLFEPNAPLLTYELLSTADDAAAVAPSLLAHAVQLDPHVATLLLAGEVVTPSLDPRLDGIARIVESEVEPYPSDREEGARLAEVLRERMDARVYLAGRWVAEKRARAAVACDQLRLRLACVDLGALRERAPADATRALQRLRRDACILGLALYFEGWDDDGDRPGALEPFGRLVARTLEGYPLPVLLGGRAPRPPAREPVLDLVIEVHEPTYEEGRKRWADAAGDAAASTDLDQLAATFRLGAAEIDSAARMARSLGTWRAEEQVDLEALQTAARLQSQPRLADVAQRIEARYRWEDIVLPEERITQLREIALQVLHRHVVYEEWGFAGKASLGRGVSALFVGESGTGKTMAAEVIAGELGLDVYKIDLSGLVSKYIGETEKNLARVFDEASGASAILFFDEADAVFGKRTEVRDSHDRYANIEVSYLLQKIEEYDGIVVLSSNLRANLDEAFLRRLKAIIDFPVPDEGDRRRIWELNFRTKAPLSPDLDLDFAARQFRVAGGNIRNIAVLAAFLAAADGTPIGMRHLIRAARREYQKLGRLVTTADFAEWYEEARR